MIKRIWHGGTTPENADVNGKRPRAEVCVGTEALSSRGLRRFDMLSRPVADDVEFVTIMEFAGLDDVPAFVGDVYERCYVPDAARRILTRFDERSAHDDVLAARTY